MNKKQIPTDAQLTAYLIQQIDIELSKPLGKHDMRYIDECNEFLKQFNGIEYTGSRKKATIKNIVLNDESLLI